MSKVIKQSGEFIAETIFPATKDSGPVWKNLAEPLVEQLPDSAIQKDDPALGLNNQQDNPDQTVTDFDADFSAPAEEETTREPTQEEQIEPEETIDVEAIMEEYFNKGVQAGMDRIESDFGLGIKALQSACEQLNTIRDTILKNSLGEMQDLVMRISEKILRKSVAEQKETIIRTVEEAVQVAVKTDEFTISLNPDDYNVIQTKSKDFINSVSGLENIVFKTDESIEMGGCLIESENCTVDATITSQLELIENAIKE